MAIIRRIKTVKGKKVSRLTGSSQVKRGNRLRAQASRILFSSMAEGRKLSSSQKIELGDAVGRRISAMSGREIETMMQDYAQRRATKLGKPSHPR